MESDLIGRSLGHFRVTERVGEGGMGVVYVAVDERLRRTVALKVLRPEIANDERRRSRFLREARFAAALAHPNVATVHEVGEHDGLVYMAMELVEGKSLRVRLAEGKIPLSQALTIARDVARALGRAHEKGIVHRDLKPENVVVYEPNPGVLAAKVLDFGLAKALDQRSGPASLEREDTATFVTAQGVALGTPGYMSPEQARGLPVDARSDVFSFGVMLYEMLTGVPPFKGHTPEELIAAVGRDEVRPLSKIAPAVPPALDKLVIECLARTAAKRPQNGSTIVKPLERLAEQLASRPATAGAREENTLTGTHFDDVTDPRPPANVAGVATRSLASLDPDSFVDDPTTQRAEDGALEPATLPAALPKVETTDRMAIEPLESVDAETLRKKEPIEITPPPPLRTSSSPPPIPIVTPDIAPPAPISATNPAAMRPPPASMYRAIAFVAAGVVAVLAIFGMRELTKPSVEPDRSAAPPITTTQAVISQTVPLGVTTPPTANPPIAPASPGPTADPSPAATTARPGTKAAPKHVITPRASNAPAPTATEDCRELFTIGPDGTKIPKRNCLRK